MEVQSQKFASEKYLVSFVDDEVFEKISNFPKNGQNQTSYIFLTSYPISKQNTLLMKIKETLDFSVFL